MDFTQPPEQRRVQAALVAGECPWCPASVTWLAEHARLEHGVSGRALFERAGLASATAEGPVARHAS